MRPSWRCLRPRWHRPSDGLTFPLRPTWRPRQRRLLEVLLVSSRESSRQGLEQRRLRRPILSRCITTGWTSEGQLFDSSHARSMPSMFALNRVMAGWRECVLMMTVGETRRCWVPQEPRVQRTGRPTRRHRRLRHRTARHPQHAETPPSDVAAPRPMPRALPSGLYYKVIKVGTGTRRPTARNSVTVHYSGWTTDWHVVRQHGAEGDTGHAGSEQCDPRLDRRAATDGRGRANPLLDSREAGLRGERASRRACWCSTST